MTIGRSAERLRVSKSGGDALHALQHLRVRHLNPFAALTITARDEHRLGATRRPVLERIHQAPADTHDNVMRADADSTVPSARRSTSAAERHRASSQTARHGSACMATARFLLSPQGSNRVLFQDQIVHLGLEARFLEILDPAIRA